MIGVSVILILTSITGNVFALLLGISIIGRIRRQGKQKSNFWNDLWERLAPNMTAMSGLFFIIFLFSISICSFLPLTTAWLWKITTRLCFNRLPLRIPWERTTSDDVYFPGLYLVPGSP